MSTSHLERTAAEPRDRDLHAVTIGQIDQVNSRVRLFRLRLQNGPVKFSAGQWLDTYVPGVPKAGGFTITSAPSAAATGDSPYLELAIQISPENAPAAWLWRPTDEILGATLQVRIGGSFVFPPADVPAGSVERLVFVAGGVGVNPLVSMLGRLCEETAWKPVSVQVLYASKIPSEGLRGVPFLERIAKLFRDERLTGRVRLYATEGEAAVEDGTQIIQGVRVVVRGRRITHEELLDTVGGQQHDRSLVYICGPPGMTDEYAELLTDPKGVGMDPRRVRTEKWW